MYIEEVVKYLRLIRLQDQYLQFGCALAAGVFLGDKDRLFFVWWAVAVTLISFSTFITNEMTDREDTDKNSWNKVHLQKTDQPNGLVVTLMWWTFSISGLLIAFGLGLFWWAVAMLVIGNVYSFKPIRLKARAAVDILAQLAVWWWIPFVAPVVYFARFDLSTWYFVISLTGLIWGAYYPYQLSDYTADKKAGLFGTHIRLGMGGSWWLGMVALGFGFTSYFTLGVYSSQPWSLIFALFAVFALVHYYYWAKLPKGQVEIAMQKYVRYTKPLSWIFVPYIGYFLFR